MTALTFFGCAFTAYGPPLALFINTVAPDPVRVIVLILSGFTWLFSLLISSLLWFAVVPLRGTLAFGLVFSVAFQELFRLCIYWVFNRTDALLKRLTENEHTKIFNNRHILSYVIGLGFGLMSGTFSVVNVLADSVGPGTIGFHGEPQTFWLVSAATGLAVILCHSCWNVIAFAAVDEKHYWGLCYVWAAHYLFSCLVSFNLVQL